MDRTHQLSLISDPGLPTDLVTRLIDNSNGILSGDDPDSRTYRLKQSRRQIPLLDDGALDVEQIRTWSADAGDDIVVVVTEIPRRVAGRAAVAELRREEKLVIISLPALGFMNLYRRLRRAIYESVEYVSLASRDDSDVPEMSFGRMRDVPIGDGDRSARFVTTRRWQLGRTRLVLGVVRTNEPLRAVAKLSAVLAAAAATGAFGIFYSSIWQMADFLPNWRLALITLIAISVMVAWLILSNGLWERAGRVSSLTEASIYNASSVLTLYFAVAVLYLGLFCGIFLVALGVIQEEFMASILGNEVNLANYVDIAWLSASMGTVAGALGSNFDDEEDIRTVIHGSRRMERFYRKEKEREEEKQRAISEA